MTIDTRLHPGNRCVFLRARDHAGDVQLLAFVAAKGRTLEVWQSPDERAVPPRRIGAFRERLEPLRIARLLAGGEAGAHLDPRLARAAVVEGVGREWQPILRGAWAHDLAARDPDLHALLSVEPDLVDECLGRFGAERNVHNYAEIASHVRKETRVWLDRWRGAIEKEVRVRVALYDSVKMAGEIWPTEGETRSFVESCVLKLGRLPREDEDESWWAGKGLEVARLTPARRRKLGLDVRGRIGRYNVRVSYLSAVEAHGWDFDEGAGWYLLVTNPNPGWLFCDPAGPYLSAEEAIDDQGVLAEQED